MNARVSNFILVFLAAAVPACTPIRSTTKAGFTSAKFATKAAWKVGKAGTIVATAPLRASRHQSNRSSSNSGGGGHYRVRGRTYHVMTSAQARGFREVGNASFYSSGRKTASGERLRSRSLTAAHKTLPFGTRVRVTNLSNRRSITVRINDRGPFVNGRVIDVTKRGADALGFRNQGVTMVRIEAL